MIRAIRHHALSTALGNTFASRPVRTLCAVATCFGLGAALSFWLWSTLGASRSGHAAGVSLDFAEQTLLPEIALVAGLGASSLAATAVALTLSAYRVTKQERHLRRQLKRDLVDDKVATQGEIEHLKSAQRDDLATAVNLARASVLWELNQTVLAVASAQSFDGVLHIITDRAREMIGAHQANTRVRLGGRWQASHAGISISSEHRRFRSPFSNSTDSGVADLVCRTCQPFRLSRSDLPSHPQLSQFLNDRRSAPPFRGWLAVPLIGQDGNSIGLIQLLDKCQGNFTADDEAILTQLAQIGASALQLFWSKQQLEHRVAQRTAELSQANEELQRSNRELDDFAYVASHDLKAPLRAIDNLSKWIAEDAAKVLPASSREHLEKMQQRVQRMELLLDDLLAYSRAGRLRSMIEWVDTRALLQNILEMNVLPTGFDVSVNGDMPTFHTRKAALEQVLRNLIANAVKHHDRPDGHVEISCRDQADHFEFVVADDGPGIPDEFHERIFRMFQTLQPRDQVEGSGVGLALVKKLVESEGGRISIDATQGRGATFRFTWPMVQTDRNIARKEELVHAGKHR